MKDFEFYLNENEARKVSANLDLAKSLILDMKSRIKDALTLNAGQYPKIVFENIYDALRDFCDAVLAIRGYKSYSHQASIAFLQKENFSLTEVSELENFRYKRNGSKYYGEKIYPADAEAIKEFYSRIKGKIDEFVSKEIEINKQNFFIIHGSYGSPNENWFPWIKRELETLGYKVNVPRFPTPKDQSLDIWAGIIKEYAEEINEETVFIAHSLGPAFVLSILENLELQRPIKACFFVSGFIGKLNNKEFDSINDTFVNKEFKWENIKKNCRNFYMYHSDNDPYVPLNKAHELAKKLNVKLKTIKNAGHFNDKAGYKKFELLLKDVLNIIKKN